MLKVYATILSVVQLLMYRCDATPIVQDSTSAGLPLTQRTALFYIGHCENGGYVRTEFIVDASYDGKRVHWSGAQNIDNFDRTYSGGGYGKPITADAEFHHRTCRQISDILKCSYYYYGTIKATVTALGEHKHIEIGALQPGENKMMPAHIKETCAKITSPDMPCPPPTEKKNCEMDPIILDT